MARLNSSALVFELLEGRCLLNGTLFSTALFTQAPRDPVPPPEVVRFDQVPARGIDSVDCGQAVDAGPMAQGVAAPSVASAGNHNGGGGVTPRVLREAQVWAPMQAFSPPPAPSFENERPPAVQNQASLSGHGALGQQVTLQTDVQTTNSSLGPRVVTVIVEGPQVGLLLPIGKRPVPQTVAVVDDIPAERLSNGSPLPPPGKDQNSGASHLTDQNAAPSQTALPISQAYAKEDRPALTQAQPVNASGPMLAGGQAAQFAQIMPRHSQEDRSSTAVPTLARPEGLEGRLTAASPIEPLSASVFESAWTSSAALLTNILPVDFSSLESSIKDFFDRIDHMGDKLSASHANLLFASGMTAVAASLAFELARRKLQPVAPAVLLQRESSIPYSDYQ